MRERSVRVRKECGAQATQRVRALFLERVQRVRRGGTQTNPRGYGPFVPLPSSPFIYSFAYADRDGAGTAAHAWWRAAHIHCVCVHARTLRDTCAKAHVHCSVQRQSLRGRMPTSRGVSCACVWYFVPLQGRTPPHLRARAPCIPHYITMFEAKITQVRVVAALCGLDVVAWRVRGWRARWRAGVGYVLPA